MQKVQKNILISKRKPAVRIVQHYSETMKCVICGRTIAPLSDRFCSKECRDIYIKRQHLDDAINGRIKKLDSLDTKLKYCREHGITYAEYQALETLGKL